MNPRDSKIRRRLFYLAFEVATSFRFRKEQPCYLKLEAPDSSAYTTFQTEYSDLDLPRTICHITAIADGESLQIVGNSWLNQIGGIVNALAVATNVAAQDAEPMYGVEITQGETHRAFLQRETRLARPTVPAQTRLCDHEAAFAFAEALMNDFEDRERLLRANQQYVFALRHRAPESKVMQSAHAWMAVEAMLPLATRHLQKLQSTDDHDFLKIAKGSFNDSNAPKKSDNIKRIYTRREFIFRGDVTTHEKAKDLSDGFEHGYADYGHLQQLADASVDKTLEYVRRAIIELTPFDDSLKKRLLENDKFSKPLGLSAYHHVTGFIEAPPGPDETTPPIIMEQSVPQVQYDDESGGYTFAVNFNMKPRREGVPMEATLHPVPPA